MQLRLLGPMALIDDRGAVALPASRKTRALLGYLATTGRPDRRDHLCRLFWEVPDDPKGALRWSLSKLRGVLGEAIVADRETAALAPGAIEIDVAALRDAASHDLSRLGDEQIERLLAGSGEFLDHLDLPNCDDFNAWRIAIAEDVRGWLGALAEELARRDLPPDRVLPHVRAWVEREPHHAGANETLMRLLRDAGRDGEAEQQRGLAIRRLGDAGVPASAALRGTASTDPEPPTQDIRFCSASDGTTLAYSVTGNGPPLVKVANWLNHLEQDFISPIWRHWLRFLTAEHCVWRYDERGNGLSDWIAPLSFDDFIDDLESVVDAAGLDRFDLVGVSQGAAVAIAYAVRHPERVRRMHLWGGYSAGWAMRNPEEVERRETMLALVRQGWALDNPAFRQMFTSLYIPDATAEQANWYNELQRITTSPENAEKLMRVFATIDVRHLLGKVTVPTLVGHSTRDAAVPFTEGRVLAAKIPGARFIAIESANHLLLESDPAWPKYAQAVREFLA
jgi:pimeloyl-ACP methyl ester carboxylesterase/DNA-binding SARP family transcriptional activator